MYEAGVAYRFTASHRLRGNFGPAQNLHSHDYRLELRIQGPSLNSDGVLLDITVLDVVGRSLVAQLDGACLDDVPVLAQVNTTMEGLAQRIHALLAVELRGLENVALRVCVYETEDAWGAYEGPL